MLGRLGRYLPGQEPPPHIGGVRQAPVRAGRDALLTGASPAGPRWARPDRHAAGFTRW
ncbi:hypothetical protein Asi03nite_16260 [Actinoplanes siamensis]|uniref:Uncharacterized protein n=1 Tax=Actinoplanes siamensis TaxID=1223317 RepID=A0A919TIR5_9ACTN|nr:hypothetical protein Asi03nite_16260 [Actinoplanes siamensis]